MSATRDKNQKFAFVYSNLYRLYKKGTEAAQAADVSAPSPGLTTSQVIKPGVIPSAPRRELAESRRAPAVTNYRPAELMGKRIAKPVTAAAYEPILHKRAEQMGLSGRTLSTPVRLTRATNDAHQATLSSLRKNMDELNSLHDRLKFMLQELEDLVKN